MAKQYSSDNQAKISAQPRLHQSAPEIQPYGTVSHLLPLELDEPVRLEMTERLNQLLADTITLRDLIALLLVWWRWPAFRVWIEAPKYSMLRQERRFDASSAKR